MHKNKIGSLGAVAEAPFGRDVSVRAVSVNGALPPFVECLLITVK
jgi:hypothetical protein